MWQQWARRGFGSRRRNSIRRHLDPCAMSAVRVSPWWGSHGVPSCLAIICRRAAHINDVRLMPPARNQQTSSIYKRSETFLCGRLIPDFPTHVLDTLWTLFRNTNSVFENRGPVSYIAGYNSGWRPCRPHGMRCAAGRGECWDTGAGGDCSGLGPAPSGVPRCADDCLVRCVVLATWPSTCCHPLGTDLVLECLSVGGWRSIVKGVPLRWFNRCRLGAVAACRCRGAAPPSELRWRPRRVGCSWRGWMSGCGRNVTRRACPA